ncbi:MAG: radical SAM protein [Actinomycetota bacterium]|nr:radical SAM protein [Actinomycetota bacterium]
MAEVGPRPDRDEVFLEYTKSICPICKALVDAEVNVRNDRVYLRKRCREHGAFEALIYSDAGMYLDSQRFNKPGSFPLRTQTEVVDGCPLDCGLCPDHKQHACLGLIEVNSNCNLDCPVCFADSGRHHPDAFQLTHEQVETALDAFVGAEGEPEVVMFSGGEPTLHPQILEFLAMARDKGIKRRVLNTNGIRLANDAAFVQALCSLGCHVYLQFDGFEPDTHLALRGRDLRAVKEAALEHCAAAGVTVSLTATVEKGLNEHEIGAIVRFGIRHPAVNSVVFQPTTHAGRMVAFDPLERMTNPDVIKAIAAQVPEWLRVSDFFPVPCCFPTCRSVTYLLVDGDEVVTIPRLIQLEDYLDYVTNRVLPDPSIRRALEKLWSASAVPGSAQTVAELDCVACGVSQPEATRDLARKAFMIVVQDFQDPYTLNVKQLMKCCVEQITPDGRLIPFCAYNSVGYREQVREQLTGVSQATLVPNALPLRPLLESTPHGSKTGADRRPVARNATNVGRRLQ